MLRGARQEVLSLDEWQLANTIMCSLRSHAEAALLRRSQVGQAIPMIMSCTGDGSSISGADIAERLHPSADEAIHASTTRVYGSLWLENICEMY